MSIDFVVRNKSDRESKVYWATERDPAEITKACKRRIDKYADRLRSTNWIQRTMRSYKYFHGLYFQDGIEGETAIKTLGRNGEYAGVAVNDFRSLLLQIKAMITKNKPSVDLIAKSTDAAALTQARQGKNVVQEYLRRAEPYMDRCVEHALIFNVGYLVTLWNPDLGEEYSPDWSAGQIKHVGEPEFSNPTIFDLIFPWNSRDFDSWKWVIIKKQWNRFDLLAKYPELEEEILSFGEARNSYYDKELSFQIGDDKADEDAIDTWCFYHLPTPALPKGRSLEFFSDNVLPGTDGPLRYKQLPVDRVVAGEMLLTCFGYSPALDMQGPQEGLNAETSTIASSHKSLGTPKIWCEEGGMPSPTYFDGFTILESQKKPEVLELLKPTAELQNGRAMFRMDQQLISGINDVKRGNPEGALRSGSGSAFAFLDAKAAENNSPLQKSYDRMIEGVGTKSLYYLSEFTEYPYYMGLQGVRNRPIQVLIQKGGFSEISKVNVRIGNPLLNSVAGRFEVASLLLQQKHITPEEFLTMAQTGTYETMLEAANAQLTRIRQEGEALLRGELPTILAIDNHALHIREHAAEISTMEAQQDQVFVSKVLAHIMQHTQALMNPGIQMMQQVLGFDLPLPAMPNMTPGSDGNPAATPGAPPQAGSKPNPLQSRPGMTQSEPNMPKPASNVTASGTPSDSVI